MPGSVGHRGYPGAARLATQLVGEALGAQVQVRPRPPPPSPPPPSAAAVGRPTRSSSCLPALTPDSRPLPRRRGQRCVAGLLELGPLAYFELRRFARLPEKDLRRALLVLVQHSLVHAYKPAPGAKDGFRDNRTYVYEVCLDRIFHLFLRAPQMLALMEEDLAFGKDEEVVVATLLHHGKLSFPQALQLSVDAMAEGGGGDREARKQQVEVAFITLIKARYIEQAPTSATPPKWMKPDNPMAQSTKKSGAHSNVQTNADAINQYYFAGASRYNQIRFSLPEDMERVYERLRPTLTPRKRRFFDEDANGHGKGDGGDGEEPVADDGVPTGEDGILWRVNFDEFNRQFRHNMCVDFIQQKLGPRPAQVVRVILSEGKKFETKVRQERSVHIALEAIVPACQSLDLPKERRMTSDQVEGALDLLTEDATELVSMATNHTNQSTYCVNMMRIMEVMQLKELEGGIRDKFGAEAMRVFSLLVYQKQLEQKQIADMAMMPLKDTREILYRLLKEEYIVLQEISKAVDHAPSRTFYLWHAKVISVSTKFLANVMEAAGNLQIRLGFEHGRQAKVIEQMNAELQGKAFTDGKSPFSEAQIHRALRMEKTNNTLETVLLKCDRALALFADF